VAGLGWELVAGGGEGAVEKGRRPAAEKGRQPAAEMGRRWRGRRDGVDSGPEVEEGLGGVVDQVRSTDRWGHSTNYKNTLKFEHVYHMSPWTVIWVPHQPAGGPPLSETASNTLKRSISVLCNS
jgi:hypothetical protein